MPLFHELSEAERRAATEELARRLPLVLGMYTWTVRRVFGFLLLALTGGVAAVMFGGHPSATPLKIASLICFVLGLVALGVVFAADFHAMRRVIVNFSWLRFRIIDNQLDVAALNQPPPEDTRGQRVNQWLAYTAFALWMAGSALLICDFARANLPAMASATAASQQAATVVPQVVPTTAPPSATGAPSRLAQSTAEREWARTDRLALLALILSFVQAAALFATFWIMRRTANYQLRAFVGPESFDLFEGSLLKPPDSTKSNQPGVVVRIRNTGSTAAYKVRIASQVAVIEPINEQTLAMRPLMDGFSSVLGPNVPSTNTQWLGRPLTPAEIADVQAGVKAIYVAGRIEYRDAYKKKRFTTFRLRYSGQFPPSGPVVMNFALQGNDAD